MTNLNTLKDIETAMEKLTPDECDDLRIRRAMATLLRGRAPTCIVMAIAELPETQPIEVVSVIGGAAPAPALSGALANAQTAPAPPIDAREKVAA